MFYQIFVIAILIFLFVWFLKATNKQGYTLSSLINAYRFALRESFAKFSKSDKSNKSTFLIKLKVFLFYFIILQYVTMAFTGFVPIIIGTHMTGLALIIHVTLASLFSISIALGLLLSAYDNSFTNEEFEHLYKRYFTKDKLSDSQSTSYIKKLYFWLTAIFAIPAILSIILALYPIFSLEGSKILIDIHRYSVVFMTISFIIHIFYSLNSINNKN